MLEYVAAKDALLGLRLVAIELAVALAVWDWLFGVEGGAEGRVEDPCAGSRVDNVPFQSHSKKYPPFNRADSKLSTRFLLKLGSELTLVCFRV